MATTVASLAQLKRQFHSQCADLPEHEQHQLWMRLAALPEESTLTHPSNTSQTPRSMSYSASACLPMTSFETPAMGRSYSISAPQQHTGHWSSPEEQYHAYALYANSQPLLMQTQLPLQPVTPSTYNTITEYSPIDYVHNMCSPSSPPSLPNAHNVETPQLQVQLTTSNPWCPTLDEANSPSNPPSALMTPVTPASNALSRQSSSNPFLRDLSMSRNQSDSSQIYPILPEDGAFFSSVDSKSISTCADTSHFLSPFAGSAREQFPSFPLSSASADVLASSPPELYPQGMTRSASSSSAPSSQSDGSQSSIDTREARRGRETTAQADRCKIAPHLNSVKADNSASSPIIMMRIRSEDGTSKDVGVITKAPYVRPQHPKIKCPHCDERPEGFRGTHELDRHVARTHTASRKGFICIDASSNGKFLADCKHCRNKKVYGAYYNAAAHLRRAHFHPRKRGRKGKQDEKRGGIGGGDDPPMEVLKQSWIAEVEVVNKKTSSPEVISDDIDPSVLFSPHDASSPSRQQPANDASYPVDSRLFNYTMCAADSEPMYGANAVSYPTEHPVDMNNFQYNVYS